MGIGKMTDEVFKDKHKRLSYVQETLPGLVESGDDALSLVPPLELRERALSPAAATKMKSFTLLAVRVLVDVLAVVGAIMCAYWLRFDLPWITRTFPPESVPTLESVMVVMVASFPVLVLFLKVFGIYNTHRHVRILDLVPRVIGAVNAYVISLLLISFLIQHTYIARGYLIFYWLLCIAFVIFGRMMIQLSLSFAGHYDVVVRNTLIVGAGNVGKSVALKLMRHKHFGLRPIGFIDNTPLFREFDEPELEGLRVLGNHEALPSIIRNYNVDKVIIAFSADSHEDLLNFATQCNREGIECSIVPRLFEAVTKEVAVDEIGGIPLLYLPKLRIKGTDYILKTLEDYFLSLLVLLFIWPILLATAIAIKLDSPGPVFFTQTRVGKGGKEFKLVKFRSMIAGAESMQGDLINQQNSTWLRWKMDDDPRVTRVGKFIRKWSLDELPQVFNVLAGDMSLVGPRPPVPREAALFKEWHRLRLNVKPGITGLWQVSGRSEVPYDEMVKLDLYYIERWSLWQDIKIMIRTAQAVISAKGAS